MTSPGGIWAVTAYFNPAGYANKKQNLARFAEGLRRDGLPLLVAELALGDAAWEVEDGLADRVLRLRSRTVLWHKERLLNLAIGELPAECGKVVWLDGDILFENADWVAETHALLDRYPVVQPFQHACWLNRGEVAPGPDGFAPGVGPGRTLPGMGFAMSRKQDKRKALANYYQHGHSGFAWAARRDWLHRHELYDRLILGGGDLAIAKALYTPDDPVADVYPPALARDLGQWRERVYAEVQGAVGYARGRVFHLWHGDNENRGYEERVRILHDCAYDPLTDLRADPQGCWEWASDKPELHHRVRDYFPSRREE